MIITVEELLNLNNINGLKVIAGCKGIHNKIKNTIITDNPDYFDLLTAGDVIITTGYPFFVLKDDINFGVNTIKMLSDNNCAALAIKCKKYFDALPASILETAELMDFPIIEIPLNMSLTQLDNIIKKRIGTDNESILERTLEVQNKLMLATFGGIDNILEEIVSLTANPVAIVDLDWKVLSYKTESNPNIDLKLYPRKKLFFKNRIEELKLDQIPSSEYLKIAYELTEEDTINSLIIPIYDRHEKHGYILLWETRKDFGDIDYVTLERSANIFALDMKKNKEMENKRNKIKSNFFEDLITGNLTDETAANNLAELYGIDETKSYSCIVIKMDINLDNKSSNGIIMEPKYYINKAVSASYEVSEIYKSNIIHIFRGNYVILFLPIKKTEEVADQKYFSKQFGEEIYRILLKELISIKITIGIGKSYDMAFDLSKSFNEALEVISLARKIDVDSPVLHFDDYIIYNFLISNISDDNLMKFYQITLSKLVKHDTENNTNFTETLDKYLKNGSIASVTAKELFIHRNTLIYKLSKISEIINVDLADSEKVLELQLALKVMKILKIE